MIRRLVAFAALFVLDAFTALPQATAARCTGTKNCIACKTCRDGNLCKLDNRTGERKGSCGVCTLPITLPRVLHNPVYGDFVLPSPDTTVYLAAVGKCYHRIDCRTIQHVRRPETRRRDHAQGRGRAMCLICKP